MLNSNYCHRRKIIDFSKIQKMTFTIDIQAFSCQEAKNFMEKFKSYWLFSYTKCYSPFFGPPGKKTKGSKTTKKVFWIKKCGVLHRKVAQLTSDFMFPFRQKIVVWIQNLIPTWCFCLFWKIIKNGSNSNFWILKKITGSKLIW